MTKEQLNKVLEKHKKWLNDEPGGEGANLWGVNLRGANLREADLRRADLQKANLRGADLWGANLRGANLWGANLREASLRRADLREANLWRVNLQGADLWRADFRGADLQKADLRRAGLWGADLWRADLREADLREADLWRADLWGTNLREANNIPDYVCPICCPEKGSFIGFKRAYAVRNCVEVIIELEIPAEAKRSSATNRKCRCSKAKVLSITDLQGIAEFQKAHSRYDNDFIYEVGKTVVVDDFDDNRWNECSTGIHFFITRSEAVNY